MMIGGIITEPKYILCISVYMYIVYLFIQIIIDNNFIYNNIPGNNNNNNARREDKDK